MYPKWELNLESLDHSTATPAPLTSGLIKYRKVVKKSPFCHT